MKKFVLALFVVATLVASVAEAGFRRGAHHGHHRGAPRGGVHHHHR